MAGVLYIILLVVAIIALIAGVILYVLLSIQRTTCQTTPSPLCPKLVCSDLSTPVQQNVTDCDFTQ